MKRFIETYDGRTFDLVVVGGGITGAAVVYDAASRGLSVALVEKQDFGGATSAVTSKLIHGGFRYLANGELGIVRESLRERRTLENIAPNLVYPIPVLIPCYGGGMTGNRWVMRTGMLLYDLLSFDKGATWDGDKRIGSHSSLPPKDIVGAEPIFPREGLKGGFCFQDCASLFPERLTLAFVRSAAKHGAEVANYCGVEGFLRAGPDGKAISGVTVRDLTNGRTVELRGTLTVNCGGPWADRILGLADGEHNAKPIRRSEGIHVITRKLVNRHMAVMIDDSGKKGFFMIPWRGHTLIGTTDKEYVGSPDEFRVTKAAVLELLDTVNTALEGTARIEYDDVLYTYGGLRPLVEDRTKDVYESSRKYEIYDNAADGLDDLITVEGGKYTTSRNLAENVMKTVEKKLGGARGACVTDERHLAGCEIDRMERFIERLKREHRDFPGKTVETVGRYHGTECGAVLELARGEKGLVEPVNDDGEILAQAVHAIRHEMALTLEDLLLRRTGIGTLGDPGDEVLARLADRAAEELGWDDERREQEVREAKAGFALPE